MILLLALHIKSHIPMTQTHQIKSIFICCFCLLCLMTDGLSQSFVFGPKLGPTLAFQRWQNIPDRGALLTYQGSVFLESYSEDSPSSLYVEAGYKRRGSTERRFFNASAANAFSARQSYICLLYTSPSPRDRG